MSKRKTTKILKSVCKCKRKSCKYHTKRTYFHTCDYMCMTGKSRLLYHRKNGLSENVEDCQLYDRGIVSRRKGIVYSENAPRKGIVYSENAPKKQKKTAPPRKTPDEKYCGLTAEKLSKLVNAGIVDSQIAILHGCSKVTVRRARWEYKIASAGKSGSHKTKLNLKEAELIYKEVFRENTQAVTLK